MFDPRTRTRSAFIAAGCPAVLAFLALSGCGNKATNYIPHATGSSTFRGTLTGGTISGTLTVTVSTSEPAPQSSGYRAREIVTATGTLLLNGAGVPTPISLSGNYDDVYKKVNLSGGGWTLIGDQTSFGLEGTFTSPSSATGWFSVQTIGAGTDTVSVFLGSFTSTSGGLGGMFNFEIRGSAIHGYAVDTGNTDLPLDGTFTAVNDSIHIVHPDSLTGPPLAVGKLNSDGTVSGTFDDLGANSGTWSGTKH